MKNTGEKNQNSLNISQILPKNVQKLHLLRSLKFLNINLCFKLALCVAPRQDKSQVAIETTLTFLDEDQSKALQATVQFRGAGSSLKLRGAK